MIRRREKKDQEKKVQRLKGESHRNQKDSPGLRSRESGDQKEVAWESGTPSKEPWDHEQGALGPRARSPGTKRRKPEDYK